MNTVEVQNALNSHGFPCGSPDGVAGPATQEAVKRFQAAYCGPGGWLNVDGIVGPQTASALQWTVANNALVSFFSIQEVACHHCGCAYVTRELLSAMFKLRQAVGPVKVVDAYRCPAHNAAIGGASDSEHPQGNAFDPAKGAISYAQAQAAGFRGIGRNAAGQIDHLDVRSGGPITFADAGNG